MRTQTSFSVGLPVASEVGIEVLDALGRRVRALHRGTMARGWSRITWDGRDNDGLVVAAGLYFVHARTSTSETSARVVVLSAE
jgi:flagellar hook assembly protein FlgD